MSSTATPEPEPRTLRTVRRKRRDDSLRTAPRRKRSKITEDSFVARGEEGQYETHYTSNGHVNAGGRKVSGQMNGGLDHHHLNGDLVVRGGRKPTVKRPGRSDGAQVLTQNANYTIKSLASTPRELRRGGNEFRGTLSASTGQALAVTRGQAFIWDYTSHATVASPKVFDVPFSVRDADPLPYGALVTAGASAETGLLLVSATSGHVVFHESIERAASLGLFQERKPGVEGTIAGIYSGEHIVALTAADSAGFIITFDSGRIAHLTLRDMQGKARIQAQFLRAGSQVKTSIFDSIKGALGAAAWKMDSATVHTRAAGQRGQVQVVAITEQAELKVWEVDWSGRSDWTGSISFRAQVVDELKRSYAGEVQGQAEQLAVLDFAFVEQQAATDAVEVRTVAANKPLDVLLLLRVGHVGQQVYFLCEMTLNGTSTVIKQLSVISSYQSTETGSSTPKLVLPRPGHTAVIMFEDAIVTMALTRPNDADPEAQFHGDESYIAPQAFQDAVYLRNDKGFAFTGIESEDARSTVASCCIFVQGAGLMRIIANDSSEDPALSQISTKSKIEQAVFFGVLPDNPLDLSRYEKKSRTQPELENAVLAISHEILTSQTSFIPQNPVSIEDNLARRAKALNTLISHVRSSYPPLSRPTMWRLLWDAERVAAGQALWQVSEQHRKTATSEAKPRPTLLHECVRMLQEAEYTAVQALNSSDDQLRQMFVLQLVHLDKIICHAFSVVDDLTKEGERPATFILRLASEADDIWLSVLNSALAFRVENAELYGLDPNSIPDGILTDEAAYAKVPEFWTSGQTIMKSIVLLTKLAGQISESAYEAETADLCSKVAIENAQLVQLTCHIFEERVHWTRTRGDQRYVAEANALQAKGVETRSDQLLNLVNLGQLPAALDLAEKYKDMSSLTSMIVEEATYLRQSYDEADDVSKDIVRPKMDENTARIERYFAKFGDEFGNAVFDFGLMQGNAGNFFQHAQQSWPKFLTNWLRADPARAKLCWINDVMAEKDYAHASEMLTTIATEQESRLWSKEVQLSLAKLSMLAAPPSKSSSTTKQPTATFLEGELLVTSTQRRVYAWIAPEIHAAIDPTAELELALEVWGRTTRKYHPALYAQLENALRKIVAHDALSLEELIDALTLMDQYDTKGPDTSLHETAFFEALKVLHANWQHLDADRADYLLRLIWKRAYVATPWGALNRKHEARAEDETHELLRNTPVYHTIILGTEELLFSQGAVEILEPVDVHDAGTSAAELAYLGHSDQWLAGVIVDNESMDRTLLSAMERYRCAEWMAECKRLALADLEIHREAEAVEREAEAEFEAEFERGAEGEGEGDGVAGAWEEDVLEQGEGDDRKEVSLKGERWAGFREGDSPGWAVKIEDEEGVEPVGGSEVEEGDGEEDVSMGDV